MIPEKLWSTDAGLPAVAVYNDNLGFRCGYVGVPPSHHLYGVDYMQHTWALPVDPDTDEHHTPETYFNVHGGITFADNNPPGIHKFSWDHNADWWWFGFDCGHLSDGLGYRGEQPRPREYVVDECEAFATQLMQIRRTSLWTRFKRLWKQRSQYHGT